MGYLISQIIFCLIAAAVLGLALGWLLHGILHHEHDNPNALRSQINDSMNENHRLRLEIDDLTSKLEEQQEALNSKEHSTSTPPLDESISAVADNDRHLSFLDQLSPDILREPGLLPLLEDSDRDSYKVEEIEGIGKGFGKRLRSIGIEETRHLLEKGSTDSDQNTIVQKIQVEAFVVKKWVSQADLLRIPGIRSQFADLLQASDIDSVKTLSEQDVDSLIATMTDVNDRERRSPVVPPKDLVVHWIAFAKQQDA